MNLIFVGPQGSGKGTQAKMISQDLKLCHISTGDLLRSLSHDNPLKEDVDSFINNGRLIPDELMLRVLKQRLEQKDCSNGIILDGFPRNLEQAKALEKAISIDKIIEIFISDKEAKTRMKGRWNCKKCGIAYNIVTMPKPKQEGICDVCREKLTQRQDDADDKAIDKRLKIYHEETEPMLKHYPSIKINGKQSIEKVTEEILNILKD